MTEDDLRQFLEENRDAIANRLREDAIKRLSESVQWRLPQDVQEVVNEFFKTEVAPVIRQTLLDQKGPIINAAVKAAAEVSDVLAKSIVERALKVISSDYESRDVIKALLGVKY